MKRTIGSSVADLRLNRRHLLAQGAAVASGALLTRRFAFAAANTRSEARLVVILLRGALDGLSAVPPYGDPAYARLRGELAIPRPGATDGAFDLDGTFGLHPELKFLAESWQAQQLTVLHAIASPYRERSHFDGQDVLENGMARAHASPSGWLNRAITALPGSAQGKDTGIALGANMPLVMRGPAAVASWSPSRLGGLEDDTLQRIADLYARDPLLAGRLADALDADNIARESQQQPGQPSMLGAPSRGPAAERYTQTVRAAAGFLVRDDGPRVAVFDTSGWDTHANMGGSRGQLAQRLGSFDAGLRALRDALRNVWQRTAVLVVTEFGRTAAANGTRGSDHGTGAAAFLLGGAVNGGRVIADWPSLATAALYQGRDLKPTQDLRALFKGVLHEHLGVARAALESGVFPDSQAAPALKDLVV
jgi:uncharacterized protein (DUF1501 family)